MAQDWQKQLPEAQGSVVRAREKKVIFRSPTFRSLKSPGVEYQVIVTAEWGDTPKNGSNCFYSRIRVVIPETTTESDVADFEDYVPAKIKALVTPYKALQKWNGCHTFGPWYYIENTTYIAGERDCRGLLISERKQIVNGRTKQLAWHRVAIDAEGNEVDLHKLDKYADGDMPPVETMTLAWRPWCHVGEGKPRDLDGARRAAIWLDATDEQLTADGLEGRLKARLPALLVEFRAVIEGLGFVW